MGTLMAVIGIVIGLFILISLNPSTIAGVGVANVTANITEYSYLRETINFLPLAGFLIFGLMVLALILRFRKRA